MAAAGDVDDPSGLSPLTEAERSSYLTRIGLDPDSDSDSGPADPVPALLAELQLAHLLAVPFENLDIHRGRGIVLDHDRILAKVVGRRRGGYCYELNSLFARLLRSFGFAVTLASARVAGEGGTPSPEFDHLTLLVEPAAGTDRRTHLVDVGFGDAFTVPLPLDDGAETSDRGHRVRLVDRAGYWVYEDDRGQGWEERYRFTVTPQHLLAFGTRNQFQQSSPDSHFTGRPLCSLLTGSGRITLTGSRLLTTGRGGERTDRELDDGEVAGVLADEFGVEVPEPPSLDAIPAEVLTNPVATLATNGTDGRPQLTAIWYCIEQGEICLSVSDTTRKAKNLRVDGRCTVLVFDPDSPNRVAEIRGWATMTPDHDYTFADRLGANYQTDFRRFDGPETRRVRVAVRPQRIVLTDVRD